MARLGVDEPARNESERSAADSERDGHAQREAHHAELARRVEFWLEIGEVLVMLAGVSFVDQPQTPHINAPVHDEPMHAPLDEIAGEEHRNYKQPLPSRANEMLRAVVDRCDAHSI